MILRKTSQIKFSASVFLLLAAENNNMFKTFRQLDKNGIFMIGYINKAQMMEFLKQSSLSLIFLKVYFLKTSLLI